MLTRALTPPPSPRRSRCPPRTRSIRHTASCREGVARPRMCAPPAARITDCSDQYSSKVTANNSHRTPGRTVFAFAADKLRRHRTMIVPATPANPSKLFGPVGPAITRKPLKRWAQQIIPPPIPPETAASGRFIARDPVFAILETGLVARQADHRRCGLRFVPALSSPAFAWRSRGGPPLPLDPLPPSAPDGAFMAPWFQTPREACAVRRPRAPARPSVTPSRTPRDSLPGSRRPTW